MKTVMLWTLALLMLVAPGAAEAISVSIVASRPGFTAVPVTPTVAFTAGGNPAVALACTSNVAGAANSTAGTTACSRTISVGGATFTIRDISTANRARVYRVDGLSSDILNLAGLSAVSSGATPPTTASPVTLKISYASSSTEFTPLPYNLYAYTAAMSGTFFKATGAAASACASTTPCVTLKLNANNVTVNQFGDNAVATVNVPPIAATGGTFGPPNNPSETKSIPCGTSGLASSCKPSLQGELTAIYMGTTETLRIVGGAAVGGSHRPTTAGGVTDTFVDEAVPEFVNEPVPVNFLRYDQAATLQATLVQDGQLFPKAGGSGQMPLWWNLKKVDGFTTSPDEPTVLRSIVSNADLFDDGAYVSSVPTNLKGTQPRDLTSLVAVYDTPTGCPGSPQPLPPNFFFVEIQLKTTPVQAIRVLLDCGDLSTQNLVTFPGVIVKLPDGSNTNWKGMLNKFGGVDIRAISVFLAPIFNPVPVDQEVSLDSLTFVAFKTPFTQSGSQTPTFAPMKCDFPGLNEFTVRATPVDANGDPTGPSFIWGDAPGETFQKVPTTGDDCQLRTAIPINDFPPNVRQNAWRFDLLYNLVPSGFGTIIVANNN
jgi:hypothetical protein